MFDFYYIFVGFWRVPIGGISVLRTNPGNEVPNYGILSTKLRI